MLADTAPNLLNRSFTFAREVVVAPGQLTRALWRRFQHMKDETRKAALLIAAAIFAARALADWDGKRSPRAVAAIANALEKAQLLVSILISSSPPFRSI